jgi:ribosomal protein S18 acetylase RimI-like enzyme
MSSTGSQTDWQIEVAPRARQGAALALVFDQLAPQVRADHVASLLASARVGKLSLDGLLEARRDGRTVAAMWTQVQPGRAAGVWPPRLASFAGSLPSHTAPSDATDARRAASDRAAAESLLAAAVDQLSRLGVRIAQALLPCDAVEDASRLQRCGFVHLADLLYLVSLADTFPLEPPNGEFEYEPLSAGNYARLSQVVERTYEATLDCPQLNGVRAMADVLEGHRAVGSFSPSRWLIVRHRNRDVGCLLLAQHASESQLEIVYTGLVREARGHGWGLAITRHAQWLTRSAGCSRLVLAVDAANTPAIRVYTAAGFTPWERRRALLRIFGDAAR